MRSATALGLFGACGVFVAFTACGSNDTATTTGCDPRDTAGAPSHPTGQAGNSGSGDQPADHAGSGGQATGNEGGNDGQGGEGGAVASLPDGNVPALPRKFAPSNLPSDLGLEVAEDLIIDGETCAPQAVFDTDKGEIRCYSPGFEQRHPTFVFKVVKQQDGSELGVFAGKNIRLSPTVTVVVEGQRPLVLLAPGDVLLGGTVQAIADSIYAGHGNGGGFSAPNGEQIKGFGPGGGGGTSVNAGGGAYCGKGGVGGSVGGGVGGVAYGSSTLMPLLGGSSGGNGGTGGDGGAGGGAVQVVAGGTLTVTATGVIHVGGASGSWDGGGGGSGGAILLEASQISIAGTLAANGGGGGEGTAAGDDGFRASPDATPAPGGHTGTASADDDGGPGSAAATLDGGKGSTTGGGGGGGAGRIRLNSASGKADVTGVLSPAATTSCATEGKLGG